MGNMTHYDNLKSVPLTALKEIGFGKLKGKSDINPQWRYESMTNEFGPCGIGWKFEIVKTWTQPAPNDQVLVFVEIKLYIFDYELAQWGNAIPGIGGDFLLEKDKNGLHGNDEAYKMATTDALGVAMKMLGVAADVYRGLANDSKYGRDKQPATNTTKTPQKATTSEPTKADSPLKLVDTKAIESICKIITDHGFDPNSQSQTMFGKDVKDLTVEQGRRLYKEMTKEPKKHE